MDTLYMNTFGKAFIPKKIRPNLHNFFSKAGYEDIPYHYFGMLFWIAALTAYFTYVSKVYPLLVNKNPISFFLITFMTWVGVMLLAIGVLILMVYFFLNIRIYNRTKEMEDKLPEYLTLVSTNIKGGFSFEKALWSSIKPELGILANEVALVSKKVMTGNDVKESLVEFANKYDSPILKRSINLIIGEIEAGGKIAHVIDNVVHDLKKTKILKKEMAANTVTYMFFIGALVMFVCPGLFALSFELFQIILDFLSNIDVGSAGMSFINVSNQVLDPNVYKLFSIAAIVIIGVSSSFIISVIEKGDFKNGFRYVPLFVITGLSVYLLSLLVLGSLFSGLVFG